MVKVELKDGSKIEVQNGSTILEVAKQISEGLARNSLAGKVNGDVNLDNLTTTKKEQRELTSKFDVALSNKKMSTNDLVKLLTALAPEKNKDNQ